MIEFSTSNSIIIDGNDIGLKVTQTASGTVVYTPENRITGQEYQAHQMPHQRYSLVHSNPASGNAGWDQFEADVKALLKTLDA